MAKKATTTATAPAAPNTAWPGAVMLPLDKLIFTPWNVNEMGDSEFSELVAEIEENGFDEPVQVVPAKDEPDHYLVLGGEHRARAGNALGMTEIPAVIKTTLSGADEATLQMWSVKRNNIRGRINAQKYAELEKNLSTKHKVAVDAARNKMLVRGQLLKDLRKTQAVLDNEPGGGTPSAGGKTDDDDGDDDDGTSAAKDAREETKSRKKLLEALKNAEQEVLLKSADTVQHGYLWFDQGNGQHLVVDASGALHGLIKRAVAACKGESAKIDEFLCAALGAELKNWEDK